MICLALTGDRVDALGLDLMSETNLDDYRTAYTVTIDASPRFGVTTGISAQDRATTIRVAVDPAAVPSDLRHGGHVFPLRAREGGVLQRVGHTEAAVDLARLAGLHPSGVICEILNEDGTAARRPQLEQFARETLTLKAIVDGERRFGDARPGREVGAKGDQPGLAVHLAFGDERDATLLVRRVAQPAHQHVGRFAGGEEPFPA